MKRIEIYCYKIEREERKKEQTKRYYQRIKEFNKGGNEK